MKETKNRLWASKQVLSVIWIRSKLLWIKTSANSLL